MAQVTEITFPMCSALKGVTINLRISGQRVARARLWVAAKVFMIGALIAGCRISFARTQRTRGQWTIV